MPEWITANWIWIVVAVAIGWVLVRGRGMGCGMGGHRGERQAMPPRVDIERTKPEEPSTATTPGTGTSRHHGGCC